ncbi:hypothetical protein K7X08_015248 [Anisodus acutangulus]|uniref:Uncharacterized protein n=1 Tax=Anisodus acutangulus TaxID=402998 RepID=A0A9Q1L5S9_9SOLA|nr:hypothetical protein K7X08_015248 [Anisodus acutangulus]
MEVEEVELLKLFDTCWFKQGILFSNTHRLTTKQVQENPHEVQEIPHDEIQESAKLLGRSQSDYCIILDDNSTSFSPLGNNSPTSVIITRNKVAQAVNTKVEQKRNAKRGVKGIIRIRRSSSDLELEELKGFLDLGFEFSEEDKNSRLVTIVPGLQKWGNKVVDQEVVENSTSKKRDIIVQRPYLSEAWEILEKRKMIRKLVKWRFPAMHNEINMKDNLKFWAQTVASTFR